MLHVLLNDLRVRRKLAKAAISLWRVIEIAHVATLGPWVRLIARILLQTDQLPFCIYRIGFSRKVCAQPKDNMHSTNKSLAMKKATSPSKLTGRPLFIAPCIIWCNATYVVDIDQSCVALPSRYFSRSMAALQPEPAAVMAWR